jgi:hypothetical protein
MRSGADMSVDVDREAWRLLLMYAESGMEDDIDEDGDFDEDMYKAIQERAMQIIHDLRTDKVEKP